MPAPAPAEMKPPQLASNVLDARVEIAWRDHRRHLLDVAYRLLGSVSEAEDMVQEAFARLVRSDLGEIEDVRGWLTTVVSRLCLDQLRSARARRETYLGPWLPEPVAEAAGAAVDPAEQVTLDDSIRMALLVVLERLSPAERVVYVLHEVFQFSFEEIARIVERSPEACRQLASRARRHVRDETGPARFAVEPERERRLAERFAAATAGGRLRPLLRLLDPQVAGWADVGGAVEVPQRVGRQAVAERLLSFVASFQVAPLLVNGQAGVVLRHGETVRAVLVLHSRERLITRIDAIADPAKLGYISSILGAGTPG